MNVFLTQYDGMILGPIAKVLGFILQGIYSFFSFFSPDGNANVGVCIIVFTFIVNGLMIPLTIKQQKFSKLNTLMAPELQAIRDKYKNKKDQESITRMNSEQQVIYNKYGVSPTAGCLPMLITLPIFFALYRVIYNVPAYVPQIKEIYENIINAVTSSGVDLMEFAESVVVFVKGSDITSIKLSNPDLANISAQSISDVSGLINNIKVGITNGAFNEASSNYLVDVLSQFRGEHWTEFMKMNVFSSHSSVVNTINSSYNDLKGIYSFFGMNIMEIPRWNDITLSIPILAVVTQFISNKIMMKGNKNNNQNDSTAASMNAMNNIMPIMSGVFCFMFPIGVGLYWVAGSVFRIIQGIFINLYFDKVGVDAIAAKNVEKRNKKLAKKGIDPNSTRMQELANTRTSSIKNISTTNTSNISSNNRSSSRQDFYVNRDIKNGSIADFANMLNRDYVGSSSEDESKQED